MNLLHPTLEVSRILEKVTFRDWKWRYGKLGDGSFIQATWKGTDTETGQPVDLRGRKWYVSPHSIEDEVVKTCWMAIETALKHEAMEEFLYEGQAPFHPHHPVQSLIYCPVEHRPHLNPEPLEPKTPADTMEFPDDWTDCNCGAEGCSNKFLWCNGGFIAMSKRASNPKECLALIIHNDGKTELCKGEFKTMIKMAMDYGRYKLGGLNKNPDWKKGIKIEGASVHDF
jgi:hypothetical protein